MSSIRFETEYAAGLLFAAELTEAATRPEYGTHGAERLKEPYAQELLRSQNNYEWCDNRQNVNVAAHSALRATVDYVARRHALSPSSAPGRPWQLWPDLQERLAALANALEFAAAAADAAWRHELAVVLEPWLRRRLDQLLKVADADEGLGNFEARVRHAVTLTHRYRLMRYELFGDRHWTGRPEAPWWCPDHDLAARSPFDGYAEGATPAHALILDPSASHCAGELTAVAATTETPRCHRFDIIDGELRMRGQVDPATRLAAQAALIALGVLPARP